MKALIVQFSQNSQDSQDSPTKKLSKTKRMKKRLLILLSLTACLLNATAENISETEARRLATSFLKSTGNSSVKRAASAETLTLAKQSSGYYLFNRAAGNGFVVVASDDAVGEPILGYADNGAADTDDIPDNLKAWLEEYDRQIAYMEKHPNAQAATRTAESERATIAPLVKSLWTQEAPYNTMCPKSGKQACLVGCTATAVAMVMRHHRWPERGQGSYSYAWNIGGTLTTISADFSQSVYNWDIMEDRYLLTATGEAADAAALLSFNVGVASHMQYSTSGSGAYLYDAGHGLLTYFDYDKSLRLVNRDYYTHDEWQDLIYGELASNRPVVYSGYTSTMYGHTFIVDGYKEGYYHFNWGWSGQYNGYFRLSALYPYGYGSNGTSYQYNYRQEVLVGIKKNAGTAYATPELLASGISTQATTTTFNDEVDFSCSLSYVGLYERNLQFGVEIKSTATGEKTYILQEAEAVDINDRVALEAVSMASFPHSDGTYEVRPIAYDPLANEYYDVRMRKTSSTGSGDYVIATVSGDNITFSSPEGATKTELDYSNLSLPTNVRAGMSFLAKATLTATGGDYLGDVSLAFYPEGSNRQSAKSKAANIDVANGGSYEADFVCTAPSPGTYTLRLVDERGNAIGESASVVVGDSIKSKLAMKSYGLTMPSTTDVDPNDIEMTLDLSCTGGSYCNNFFIHFYEQDGTAEYLSLTTDLVSIAEGDDLLLNITGAVEGLKPSTTYTAYVLYNSGSWVYVQPFKQSQVTFTTAEASGITDIAADGTAKDIHIYNMSGELMSRQRAARPSLEGLPHGIYIVKTTTGSTKVVK